MNSNSAELAQRRCQCQAEVSYIKEGELIKRLTSVKIICSCHELIGCQLQA